MMNNSTKFANMNKVEAKAYFDFYLCQIPKCIERLKRNVHSEGIDMNFDYSIESLIPLWEWYEGKIELVEKSMDQVRKEAEKFPEWMYNYISRFEISPDTLFIGMDVAIYFAEVIIKHSNKKVRWGFFTKPKSRESVNEPTLLGFKCNMDLNPRLIVLNCTRQSSKEKKITRLYDMLFVWLGYVE